MANRSLQAASVALQLKALWSYRPQMAVTKMVQYLKGAGSRILLQEFAQLRKQFWGRLVDLGQASR